MTASTVHHSHLLAHNEKASHTVSAPRLALDTVFSNRTPLCQSACYQRTSMTDSDTDVVISTQALTQQVDVSPMQADIDNMHYDDDDDSIHDDDSDSGLKPQTVDPHVAADGEDDPADADNHDTADDTANNDDSNDSKAQPHIDDDSQLAPSTAAPTGNGKLKRPPSAYFLFCADKRAEVKAELGGQSVTAVAKALGERWKQLTLEQKQQYEQTARTAKATYNQQQHANPNPLSASSPTDAPFDPLTLVLPLSHIKRILHKDPAHARLTKQAALALSYAVQLFVLDLSRRCWLRVRGGKRRVVRMEEVMAVVEGGVGLEWLRGEMRRMTKEMEKVREAEKKKREEEREKNKENDAAAANSAEGQQLAENDKESRGAADDADPQADTAKEAAEQGAKVVGEVGKKKRKAGKPEIDVKQYKSITSMFSRMQQHNQQQQVQQTEDEEQRDEIEEIEVDEVDEVDEDSVQMDKRQRTTELGQLEVEELSEAEEDEQRGADSDREEQEAEMEDPETVTVLQRSKRRTVILDDDDIDEV